MKLAIRYSLFAISCWLLAISYLPTASGENRTAKSALPFGDKELFLESSVELVTSEGRGSGTVLELPGCGSFKRQFQVGGELLPSNFELETSNCVLTAFHLVEEGFKNGKRAMVAGKEGKVIKADPENDLALVQIDGGFLPGLKLSEKEPEIGDRLFFVGQALGLFDRTFGEAILVHKDRTALGIKVWQITGIVLPGQSGGAVVNKEGRLVGLLSMTLSGYFGLNFVIPLPAISSFVAGAWQTTNDQ